MQLLELLTNVVVVTLLCVTIGYCWRLNQRIRVLQQGRSELAQMLLRFDNSTKRATDSVSALQNTSKKLSESIQARLEKANAAADDLLFLIERAGQIADRLEGDMAKRAGAKAERAEPAVAPKVELKSEADSAMARRAKKLMEVEPAPVAPAVEDEAASRERSLANLQAMLEKIASKSISDPALRGQKSLLGQPGAARARSRVERELLDVVKAESSA